MKYLYIIEALCYKTCILKHKDLRIRNLILKSFRIFENCSRLKRHNFFEGTKKSKGNAKRASKVKKQGKNFIARHML